MATPSMRLVWNAQGEIRDAARRCEAEIFYDWFGNTAEQLDEEYGAYEESTVFNAVVDEDGEVHGVVRSIVPGPAGLKTLDDLIGDPWRVDPDAAVAAAGFDAGAAWDLTTLGVRRGTRHKGVMALEALLYGTLMGARVNGYTTITTLIDINVRRLMESLGLILHDFPGTRPGPYLGSPATSAVHSDIDAMLERQRRLAPKSHRAVRFGEGLTGVDVPPLESMRLAGVRRVIDLAGPRRPAGSGGGATGGRRAG
jgi:hypothetical protein